MFCDRLGHRARVNVGVTRIGRALNRVRASRADKKIYKLPRAHLHRAPGQSGVFPYYLVSWRRLVVKFALFYERSFPDWLPFWMDLELKLLVTPDELPQHNHDRAVKFADSLDDPALFAKLWQASRAEWGENRPGGYRLRLDAR